MKSYYLYTVTGQTTGPHTSDEIRAMLRAKKLPAGTRICQVGEGMWHPLEEVFRPAKPKAPVPPVHPVPPMPVQPMPPVLPVPPMPAQPMPPVHPVPPMPAQPMPPVHPVPPMPVQPMPPVHPVPPMPVQPMPPVHPVPPMPAQPMPSTPAAPVQPAPEEEPEPEHKPLPHWNWDAISPKYWSFTGRLDQKTFTKSISFGGVSFICSIPLMIMAKFACIDYLPCAELVDGKYAKLSPFGYDYFPLLMMSGVAVMMFGGLAMLVPPYIRRLHDIGINVFVAFALYVAFAVFMLFTADIDFLPIREDTPVLTIFFYVFILFILTFFASNALLAALPGSRKDNRYGPSRLKKAVSTKHRVLFVLNMIIKVIPGINEFSIPHKEDERYECKIEWKPASWKVILLTAFGLLAVIGLGSWCAYGFNHGTARELAEAIDKNDAAEVQRCLDNGAEVNVMYCYNQFLYGDEDFCTPLFLAVQKYCSADVLRALKAAGAKRTDLKGVRRNEDYANSSLDGPKKYKWEPLEISKDSDSYKEFKKIFKEPKKKKKKRD